MTLDPIEREWLLEARSAAFEARDQARDTAALVHNRVLPALEGGDGRPGLKAEVDDLKHTASRAEGGVILLGALATCATVVVAVLAYLGQL